MNPFIYFFVILEMRVASLWLLCVLLVGVTSAEVLIPMCTLLNRVICSYNCFSSYELFVTCFFYFLPDMKCQETKIPKVKAPTPKTPNTIIDGKHSTYSV